MEALQTTRKERMAYGGFFMAQNILYAIQFQFLGYFYTEYVGITLGAASLIILLARIWDAFNDPVMGAIVDRTNFEKGKYIPWLKVVTYVVPLFSVLIFLNPGSTPGQKVAFAAVSYVIWGMVYTMSDAPLFSLGTVMGSSMFERDKMLAIGRLGAALGVITTAVFMSVKVQVGWFSTALIYSAAAFFLMFPLTFLAKERVKHEQQDSVTFKKIILTVIRNKYLMIYYIGYLSIMITNTLQVIAPYFAKASLGSEEMVTIIMGISIIPVIIVSMMLPRLIRLFGKKKLTVWCGVIFIVLCVIQYVAGYENMALFLGISAIRTMFMQIPILIYGMFTADCIEYGAYLTGQRTEGVSFSIQTLMTKLGGGLAAMLVLQMLNLFDYVEGASVQAESTLQGIWIILTLVPIIGFLVMMVMMYFYRLDETLVEKMKRGDKDVFR